ncbi:LacI family DNA-binding transcriptional regulator [Clostridium sediminicola]|uniref:LacI family DNA-binding transcriptional regulator n=1 Tax=Clostridium sediminicola TaxID=3114879 RepID=UPI0031F27444
MATIKNLQKKTDRSTTKRITSIDVAHRAGVSQSTVSRALNPNSKLAEDLRQKVLVAARELGYKPNAIARSLTSRRTNIIGLVMSDPTSPFYHQVLSSFTDKLQQAGLQTLLFNAAPGKDIDDILDRVLQYQVDGLIITGATITSEMADECVKNGTPVILFNRYIPGANISAVCCNDVEGGRKVADFLVNAGHKRLAYISGKKNASTSINRYKGFIERLNELGNYECLVEYGGYSYESGVEAAKRLLMRKNQPDAIFCVNDIMALGVMDVARFELGISIPKDLSVIGFDDIPEASRAVYSLTTIYQPIEQMVDATIKLLQERVENRNVEPVLQLFEGKLIERSSTRLISNNK